MIDFKNIKGIYFIGIGGIGMSALALYYARLGYIIAGYDRTRSSITENLSGIGCDLSYTDNISTLPELFSEPSWKNSVLIIFTPAVPAESKIFSYFRGNGYNIYKRSELLGEISSASDTIAVAGTHGKTTVSTMTAHLLKQSHVDCSAFLGGISKNYDSNLLLGKGSFTVMEADEFDRSFLRLSPLLAVITAIDADHLDIYGDHQTMIEAYKEFCRKIRPGGTLLLNNRIKGRLGNFPGITSLSYGHDPDADFRSYEIQFSEGQYRFNMKTPAGIIYDLLFPFPGITNIENLTAAIALALKCGVTEAEIRRAILSFRGVKRRFDIRVNLPGITYIDDYAHHPEEISACIRSVRDYFTGRKLTGIFQPHLFSRTLEHAEGFAKSLDELDEVILLPIYPAREKPVPGVTSELIFNKMKLANKRLLSKEDLPELLDPQSLDVLITIGAGDIDTLVTPIEKKLKEAVRE